MPSDAHRSLLLGDSASESDGSARSGGVSASSRSCCGGGAGCGGCEPRLAISVVAMGEGEGDDDDDDDDDLDSDRKSPRGGATTSSSGIRQQQQRRRQRVRGRAVLHEGGGFSFREDRGKPRPPATSTNPFSRCFSWLCGGGSGEESERRISGSSSYDVEASDLVGALEVPATTPNPASSSPSASRSGSPAFAPFSASRGCLPPLRPVPSSSRPSSPRSPSSSSLPTTEEVVSRIRAAAAPWDNQLPSDPPRPRRALVVINPAAGGGKGLKLFESLLAPMLEAAGVAVEGIVLTKKKGDAARAAATANPLSVGALVAVGGDGTAAELLQGLMTRAGGDSAEAARRMPLAILPAGSGNALALSSCCRRGSSGASSSSNFATSSSSSPPYPAASICATRAAAAIARGRSAPLDVVVADSSWEGGSEEADGEERGKRGPSSSPSSMRFASDGALLLPSSSSSSSSPSSPSSSPLIARRFAFLSLTYGLIANADVGTDPWRWMGALRFTLGALREVAARRSHGMRAFVVDAPSPSVPSSSSSSSSSSSTRCRFPGALPTPLLDSLPASALLPGVGPGAREMEQRKKSSNNPSPWRRLAADDAALFACCNLPRLDASTHLAPAVRRDCGSLHLVRTRGAVPRLAALRLLSEVESGSHVLSSSTSNSPRDRSEEKFVSVDRVRALLLRPLDTTRHGRLALDGEELPAGKPIALEVVPGGARLLVTEF